MPRGRPKATRETKTRKPVDFMAHRKKLDVSGWFHNKYPGKVGRFVNNEDGRVQAHMEMGWEVVEGDNAAADVWRPDAKESTTEKTYVTKPVGLGKNGQPMDAVLMMIDKDRFDEYRAAQDAHVDQTDKALKGGAGNAKGADVSGIETYAADTGNNNRGLSMQTN